MMSGKKYWLQFALLACYAFVISSAQFMALGTLLNSDAGSTISKETQRSQPFNARPTLALGKHGVPSSNSVDHPDSHISRSIKPVLERNRLIALPFTYTTLISHFPYPPFWPRDPSRV